MAEQVEQWKVIPGYSNYEASTEGRIKNIITNRCLKDYKEKSGYMAINLNNNLGESCRKRVHQWIALTWLENPKDLPTINHINKIKDDNRVINLEWASYTMQEIHKRLDNNVKGKTPRMVIKYTLEGVELSRYDSTRAAALSLGDKYNHKCIGSAIANKTHVYGFKWDYVKYVDLQGEEWRPLNFIERAENCFVSNYGNIKRNGYVYYTELREDGYLTCGFGNKTFRINVLVAKAFIVNNDPKKDQVNHKDGNKANNNVENLEWATGRENMQHAIRTGLVKSVKKVVYYDYQLNIINIYDSMQHAARELKIGHTTIETKCKTQVPATENKNSFKFLEETDDSKK